MDLISEISWQHLILDKICCNIDNQVCIVCPSRERLFLTHLISSKSFENLDLICSHSGKKIIFLKAERKKEGINFLKGSLSYDEASP